MICSDVKSNEHREALPASAHLPALTWKHAVWHPWQSQRLGAMYCLVPHSQAAMHQVLSSGNALVALCSAPEGLLNPVLPISHQLLASSHLSIQSWYRLRWGQANNAHQYTHACMVPHAWRIGHAHGKCKYAEPYSTSYHAAGIFVEFPMRQHSRLFFTHSIGSVRWLIRDSNSALH